jgi:hypothetical protein
MIYMKPFLPMFIASLCLLSPIQANADFEDGLIAAEKEDYATTLKEWRPLAEKGDADAQVGLGIMYESGNGVLQYYKQAVAWYRKAAAQNNAVAQFNLGVVYENGQGVAKDYKQAMAWYRKAAEQGDSDAQYNLGC